MRRELLDTWYRVHQQDASACEWRNITSTNSRLRAFYTDVAKCFHINLNKDLHMESSDTQFLQLECIPEQRENGDQFLDSILHYLEILNGSTITFFGDSIMKQQYAVMSCMLNASSQWALTFHDENLLTTNVVKFKRSSITLRHRKVGFLFKDFDKFEERLRKDLTLIQGPHVILMNQGIHHNSISDLSHLPIILNKTIAVVTENSRNSTKFIWRETTPQNHPTSNGWWSTECHLSCPCIPLTPQMLNGSAKSLTGGKTCHPSCLPNNYRNDIIEPIIQLYDNRTDSKMSFVKIYKQLAYAKMNLHVSDVDYTHWGLDALLFLNLAWLPLVT